MVPLNPFEESGLMKLGKKTGIEIRLLQFSMSRYFAL
jgi:hypothetical protein